LLDSDSFQTGSLSIVIVNYRTRELLRDCLRAIQRSGASGPEVIVVDNDSRDGSAEMVRAEFPGVRLIENSDNRGFSAANNQGIKETHGKYVLLLNSDTVLLPGALAAMSDFMDQHPEAGAVGCRLLCADGRIQISAGAEASLGIARVLVRLSGLAQLVQDDKMRRFLRRYLGFALGSTVRACLEPYATDESPLEVDLLSGACLMLRRQAIDKVGLLDERFFMYLEDLDYSLRFRHAGWKLYYLPAVSIVHLVGKSSGGQMRKYNSQAYDSLFYFYMKHRSARLLAVRTSVLVAFCCRWVTNALLGAFSDRPLYRQNRSDSAHVVQFCWGWNSSPRLTSRGAIDQRYWHNRSDGSTSVPIERDSQLHKTQIGTKQ
jgi:GT2 family glycosyltransferase